LCCNCIFLRTPRDPIVEKKIFILFVLILFSVGGKKDSVHRCRSCSGSGITVQLRQLGPGMVQQMQSKCSDCNGEGEVCREKDRCKICKGQKFVDEEKILEVRMYCRKNVAYCMY